MIIKLACTILKLIVIKQINQMFFFLFYIIDFFKSPITFSYKGQSKRTTASGFILSLFILAYLIYGFTTSNMFRRINPSINIQNIVKTPYPNLLLNKDNFAIFTALQNINGTNIVEPSVFNFIAIIKTINTATGEATTYDEQIMRLCKLSDFFHNETTMPWDGGYCFNYDKLEIEGFWTTSTMKYLQIQLKRCRNDTYPGVICKSEEEITNFLTSSTFGFNFYFTDKTYDLDNLNTPISTIYTNKYTIMNQQMFKYIDYFIKKVVLINDGDYIFENNEITEAHIYSHAEVETKLRGNDNDDVLSIANFFSDQNTQFMVRRYQKFSEVVAQLGGMGSVLISVGFILLSLYHRFHNIMEMANNNYNFQKIQKKMQKKEENGEEKCDSNRGFIAGESLQSEKSANNSEKRISHNFKSEIEMRKKSVFSPEFAKNKNCRSNDNIIDSRFEKYHVVENNKIAEDNQKNNNDNNIGEKETIENKSKNNVDKIDNKNEKNEKIIENSKISIIPIEIHQESHENKLPNTKKDSYKLQKKELLESLQSLTIEIDEKKFPTKENEIPSEIKSNSAMKINISPTQSPAKSRKSFLSKKKIQQNKTLIKKFQEIQAKQKKNYELNFSFYEYVKYKIKSFFNRKLNEKEKLFEKACERVQEDTDIYKIMNKIKEIDRLKVVMMGEKNIKLFDFLAGHMIYLDQDEVREEDKKTSYYKISKSLAKIENENQLVELIEYFEFLKNCNEASEQEKRLVDLVEDKIQLFNCNSEE